METTEYVLESVFNQKFPFASDVINLKSYFSEYGESVKSSITHNARSLNARNTKKAKQNRNNFFKVHLDINDDEVEELRKITSIDNLTCEGELRPFSVDSVDDLRRNQTLPQNNLATLKTTPGNNHFVVKYQACETSIVPLVNNCTNDLNPFTFDTVVFCVKVYHPFSSEKNNFQRPKLLQEIHLLGNHTLCDLKDKIECNMDYVGLQDMSDDYYLKDVGLKKTAKELYPSSFIFIENMFYHSGGDQNTQVLKDWAEKRGLGPFQVLPMDKKEVAAIRLKIGQPYVYQHQGNCEHIVLFSDVRFLNSCDPMKTRSYPKIHAIGTRNVKQCMMCGDGFAKKLVINNKRLTNDVTYLCNRCYESYNYKNGVKIGDFAAYEYVDPAAIL